MPSNAPPPVLHDCAGWSPYQQHTSVAREIESPTDAMLVGRGGAAAAVGTKTAARRRLTTKALRAIEFPIPRRSIFYTRCRSAGRRRRLSCCCLTLGLVARDEGIDLAGRAELGQRALGVADRRQPRVRLDGPHAAIRVDVEPE